MRGGTVLVDLQVDLQPCAPGFRARVTLVHLAQTSPTWLAAFDIGAAPGGVQQ
jgi:hypothetical protein